MTEKEIEECLVKLMWESKNRKEQSDAPSVARRWAVLYTDLEHVLAYYQATLKSKEEDK